jgi:NAD(P)-dependent dehydrogenase (short-subunit alcohol dehydrogenase family)
VEQARGEFSGQTVLITGAGRGLGRIMAESFAREGASVVVADIEEEAAERVAERLQGSVSPSAAISGDVSNPKDCERWVEVAVERFGGLDVLVNNASIGGPVRAVREMDLEGWEQTLAVNLTGAMLCSQAALAVMLPRERGNIVNVASNVGKRGLPLRSPYVASKWGMLGLTQTLALELAQEGIRVNAVCPGAIRGERVEGYIRRQADALGVSKEEVREEWLSGVPMRRMVEPEEVADVVLFLASDRSSAMTGQSINVTAGMLMH